MFIHGQEKFIHIFTFTGVILLNKYSLYKNLTCLYIGSAITASFKTGKRNGIIYLWLATFRKPHFFLTGTFARIYSGVLTGPGEKQQHSVLVKTVSGMATEDQVNLLLIESSMLKDLTHRNLLPVMAVCLEDEKQPLVMFPFMNRGNLKLFMKKSRSPEGGSKVGVVIRSVTLATLYLPPGIQNIGRPYRYVAITELKLASNFITEG